MRETNIRKSSSTLKRAQAVEPRRTRSTAPAPLPSARPAAGKPKQATPSEAPKPIAKPAALPSAPARSFDASAFASHDEAARAALQKTRAAWISDADGELSRARFCEVMQRAKRPSLLVSASLSTLQREKARLSGRTLLLQSNEGKLSRGDAEALRTGSAGLVLLTIDTLMQEDVLRALERASVGAVAVDGAELAAAHGHELRPAFARLPELLPRLGKPALFALARPVPRAVRTDAQRRLGLVDVPMLEAPPVAASVLLETRAVRGERRNATLLELLADLPRPGVILCATPHEVDAVCAVIGPEHGSVCRSHAAMPASERAAMRARFESESRALLVTTSALAPDAGLPGLGETATTEARVGFGLQGARADLGFILHHHAPASLEQYVRELSSLGAANSEAVALLFYDSSHRSTNHAILEQQRLPALKVEPFARALEAALNSGKPLRLEALALQTGLSRRTSERFVALFSDAGLVRRDKAGVALLQNGEALHVASAALGAALTELQRGDASRLAAVERYAEATECKRRVLAQYFGASAGAACGHCTSCRARGGSARHAGAR
ncbi:MAG: RecQ family zinc-binding domain-containing protein [Myxococcota bacterium]